MKNRILIFLVLLIGLTNSGYAIEVPDQLTIYKNHHSITINPSSVKEYLMNYILHNNSIGDYNITVYTINENAVTVTEQDWDNVNGTWVKPGTNETPGENDATRECKIPEEGIYYIDVTLQLNNCNIRYSENDGDAQTHSYTDTYKIKVPIQVKVDVLDLAFVNKSNVPYPDGYTETVWVKQGQSSVSYTSPSVKTTGYQSDGNNYVTKDGATTKSNFTYPTSITYGYSNPGTYTFRTAATTGYCVKQSAAGNTTETRTYNLRVVQDIPANYDNNNAHFAEASITPDRGDAIQGFNVKSNTLIDVNPNNTKPIKYTYTTPSGVTLPVPDSGIVPMTEKGIYTINASQDNDPTNHIKGFDSASYTVDVSGNRPVTLDDKSTTDPSLKAKTLSTNNLKFKDSLYDTPSSTSPKLYGSIYQTVNQPGPYTYTLGNGQNVYIKVYDTNGNLVKTHTESGTVEAGENWSSLSTGLPAGNYRVTLDQSATATANGAHDETTLNIRATSTYSIIIPLSKSKIITTPFSLADCGVPNKVYNLSTGTASDWVTTSYTQSSSISGLTITKNNDLNSWNTTTTNNFVKITTTSPLNFSGIKKAGTLKVELGQKAYEPVENSTWTAVNVDIYVYMDYVQPKAVDPANDNTIDLTIRKMWEGWNTLCLPVTLSKQQFQDALGNDSEAFEFKDVDDENRIMKFRTTDANDEQYIKAGTPYLIWLPKTTEIPVFTDVDASTSVTTGGTVTISDYQYIGYVKKTTIADNTKYRCIDATGTKLAKLSTSYLNGERCAFLFPERVVKSAKSLGTVSRLSLEDLNGEATRILEIDNNGEIKNVSPKEMYNLHGQRVAKATKGIYITNGKKFIVK